MSAYSYGKQRAHVSFTRGTGDGFHIMVGGDTQPRQVHEWPKEHARLSRHVRCDDRAQTKIAYERGISKAEDSLGQRGSRAECISRRALACVCAYPSHPRFSGMGQSEWQPARQCQEPDFGFVV